MKTRFSLAILVIIVGWLTLSAFQSLKMQTRAEESKFLILIQTKYGKMILKCVEGCAWKELTFTNQAERFRTVHEYGLIDNNDDAFDSDDDVPNFLFDIQKASNGINLVGKKGTAWKTLNFSCLNEKCYQYIDQNGMTHF